LSVPVVRGGEGPTGGDASEHTLLGRLHIATLVMQRTRQLEGGARPHTDTSRHKLFRCALSEVLSGAISWTVGAATGASA
jgi:hypothetical protein